MTKAGKRTGRYKGRAKGQRNRKSMTFVEALNARLPPKRRADLLAQLCEGVEVSKKDKLGRDIVYSQPPNVDALKLYAAYADGTPLQRTSLEGKDGQPIPVIILPAPTA